MNEHGFTTGSGPDAIELLTKQHREVERLWAQAQESHTHRGNEQRMAADEIVKMLSQHDAIETQFLYPELRKRGGDRGKDLSGHSLEEHQQVRDLLSEVDGNDVTEPEIFAKLAECVAAVAHHVEEEEQQIFPFLREICDQQRIDELGAEMEAALKTAPTHPHPHTPNSKLGATVAGAVAGAVDRVRDAGS